MPCDEIREKIYASPLRLIRSCEARTAFSGIEVARAAPVEVPAVDSLSLRVPIDSAHDQFLKPVTVQGVRQQPPELVRRARTSFASRTA